MAIRVTQAARYLQVSPSSIRKWCNEGVLDCDINVYGQRVFTTEALDAFKIKKLGAPAPKGKTVFYIRSSNGQDVLLETQEELLTAAFGCPDHVYKDKGSGLNENRKGLNTLLNEVEKGNVAAVAITSYDRLSRFGNEFIKRILDSNGTELLVLESEKVKEPQEVLLQDFMSLLASFSGKFYRLRGWENQRRLLQEVEKEVDSKQKRTET